MSRNQWVKVTDCPYAAEILTELLRSQPMNRTKFVKYGNGQTIKQALSFLESLGLIRILDLKIPRITSEITLTEKGERIAQLFKMIQECS